LKGGSFWLFAICMAMSSFYSWYVCDVLEKRTDVVLTGSIELAIGVAVALDVSRENSEEPLVILAREALVLGSRGARPSLIKSMPVECPVAGAEIQLQTAWEIFRCLRLQGWTFGQSVAVLGNATQECSLEYFPEYGAPYKGLFQLSELRWNRQVEQGFDMETLQGQLDGMVWEFENYYSDAYRRFRDAESVGEATRIFVADYEGGGGYGARLSHAEQFAEIFGEYRW